MIKYMTICKWRDRDEHDLSSEKNKKKMGVFLFICGDVFLHIDTFGDSTG